MNPPSKPAPPGPQAAKPAGVSPRAILAIVGAVVLSGLCCAGLVVLGTFAALMEKREQARREAIVANRNVATAFQEAAITEKKMMADIRQGSAEINKAFAESSETLERMVAELEQGPSGQPLHVESADTLRTWTRGDFTLRASFVRLDGENVILRNEDGTEISVPLDELSAGDQCVATMSAPSSPEPSPVP
jgi:hypothetical protein